MSEDEFGVNPMQRRLVAEYLVDYNGFAAAKRAGYTGSDDCLKKIASVMLALPAVKKILLDEYEAQQKRTLITADRVLCALYEVATSDIGDIYEGDGILKKLADIPAPLRRVIQSIDTEEIYADAQDGTRKLVGHVQKIKFWDKMRALELLAKHLNLIIEKKEVTVSVGLYDRVKEARDRVETMLLTQKK